MEFNGIRIDTELLATLSQQLGEQLTRLEAEIYELAGHPFNIGSPKQLQKVLFEEQKLPMQKKTKTGGSTDAEVLEELARLHPLPAKIMEFRQYAKLKSTYVDAALPQMVHPVTQTRAYGLQPGGRRHRPVELERSQSAKYPGSQRKRPRAFLAVPFSTGTPGWQPLLAADYSQIELRMLAHYFGG